MHYLGGLRGAGVLTCGDKSVARAEFDFDGYRTHLGQVTGCGEIRMAPNAMRIAFGRKDLHLLTDDGRRFKLRFSNKRLRPDSDIAHVDITGELPAATGWHH